MSQYYQLTIPVKVPFNGLFVHLLRIIANLTEYLNTAKIVEKDRLNK